jgi:formylglycine-generating enzyme required for sulfatase activity
MKKAYWLLFIAVAFSLRSRANGIVLSNLTSVNGPNYVQLQFDLSWNNSWFNATNHDAAWVLFKFKDNDGQWKHLNLAGANNTIGAGFTIVVPPDLTGAIIRRTVTGSGTVTLTGVQVGVMNLPGNFDIKGFALEMVQIPLNVAYYLGDGESGTYYENGPSGLPFFVNSNSIVMGLAAGQLNDGIANGALAVGFPVGYSVSGNLYMMKHEITQAAYRDFLNTLTYTQQATRTAFTPNGGSGTSALANGFRNSIKITTSGVASTTPAIYGCNLNGNGVYNESDDGEWIACCNLTWMDVAAFLDWAGLRPMTEMEFEKACRGPVFPESTENAAGTIAAAAYVYPINSSGSATESITYSGSVLNGNFTYVSTSPGGNSPLRAGIHATANATRISAGAGYYGALDLSGNVEEFAVTSASNGGRSFTGVNGNGTLNASGDADEDFWPGINGNTTTTTANTAYAGSIGVTAAAGIMPRGGGCGSGGFNNLKVSYRFASPGTSARGFMTGGRGVKSW